MAGRGLCEQKIRRKRVKLIKLREELNDNRRARIMGRGRVGERIACVMTIGFRLQRGNAVRGNVSPPDTPIYIIYK